MLLTENKNTVVTSIETEMQVSYLDYAMSVIISRALPDCRDGLKPVQRRIIYAMYAAGNDYDKPYRKSVRIVGDTMGKYHPHGDSPIYGALVRMAQPFSLREVLIDGQGNFGSIDDDPPAQMRYTEARLSKLSNLGLLTDLDKDTVEFQDNYDGSQTEPKVLPVGIPHLLVNGASGIAVGMATNIPTHNLGEVLDGCCAYLDNRNITAREMLKYIPAPDFPSGGKILNYRKVENAMMTGRGTITLCGSTTIEPISENKDNIVITELPYQVNKSELIKSIEILTREKTIDGIVDIRDESNKLGIRVVIELRKDANALVILNQLHKHTSLSSSFSINMLAIKNGEPALMNVLDVIASFIKFREEVVTKKNIFLLEKDQKREHILLGMLIARDNIDEVIRIIRSSADQKEATQLLLSREWDISRSSENVQKFFIGDIGSDNVKIGVIKLTAEQVQAILEMRLQRLTKLENDKVISEIEELRLRIAEYKKILSDHEYLCEVIRKEFTEMRRLFPSERLTKIEYEENVESEEDLIDKEDIVITLTNQGYIKSTLLKNYNEQKRGGRGRTAMSTYDGDFVTNLIVCSTHDDTLFFSSIGRVYSLKAYKIPLCPLQSKGRAIVNMLPLSENEVITNILSLSSASKALPSGFSDSSNHSSTDNTDGASVQDNSVDGNSVDGGIDSTSYDESIVQDGRVSIVFATKSGYIRRNDISDFQNIQSNGKIAIKLDEDDKLIGVVTCKSDDHIFLATKNGKAICFPVDKLRVFRSRTSDGVRAMSLSGDDCIVSLDILDSPSVAIDIRESYLKIPVQKRAELKRMVVDNMLIVKDAELNAVSKQYGLDTKSLLELVMREKFVLTVTNYGFGKVTSCYEYRVTNRGGTGITNISNIVVRKNAKSEVIGAFPVELDDSIVIVTKLGILIRVSIRENIRVTGRSTAGVKVINLQTDDMVCSVKKISLID